MLKINFRPFPVLTTERLVLRQITVGDTLDLHRLRSNKQVCKYVDLPRESLEEVKYFIQRADLALADNEYILWALTLKGSNRLIGSVCYWHIAAEHHRAEIGYLLHPDWQCKGLMREALNVVLQYGFKVMKLHTAEARLHSANQASLKLLEHLNFTREGYFKENYFFNGGFIDTVVYTIITPLK